jgi:DnaJ-class molecular chaperone
MMGIRSDALNKLLLRRFDVNTSKSNEEIFVERLFNQELEDIYWELKEFPLSELQESTFCEGMGNIDMSLVKLKIIDVCENIADEHSECPECYGKGYKNVPRTTSSTAIGPNIGPEDCDHCSGKGYVRPNEEFCEKIIEELELTEV